MPIYEYQCTVCGHTLEAFQKMSEEPLLNCPACQQPSLSKLISAAGFQLKGTGWYATDFKNKGKPQSTSAESDTSKKDNKPDTGSSTSSTDTAVTS